MKVDIKARGYGCGVREEVVVVVVNEGCGERSGGGGEVFTRCRHR